MHGLKLWSGGLWPIRLFCHLLGMGFLIAFPFPIKIFSYILYSFLLSLCFVWRLGGFLIRWIFLSGSDDVVGSVWVSAVAAPIPHSDYLKSDQEAKLPNYCHIWWHSPCHERANPHLSVIRTGQAGPATIIKTDLFTIQSLPYEWMLVGLQWHPQVW